VNRVLPAFALIALISCSSGPLPLASELVGRVHALDLGKPYEAAGYAFLKDAIGDRSIVQLGESIHVTQEFPRARLRLVQYLHEEMGFDVLAFEGSLIDTWLAQDYIYRSHEPEQQTATQAMKLAFFGLWQTDPMREVMQYIVRTQATPHPLYLSDFDIQPGMGRINRGATAALGAFLQSLRAYDSSVNDGELDRWKTALGPALSCDAPDGRELPLAVIEEWIGKAAAKVAIDRPEIHAAALRLVPSYIRARIAHCQEVREAGGSRRTYQIARDRLNAVNAIALRDTVSNSHRIMLWAHHSHVNHNTSGQGIPSMGQHLLAAAPDSVYTVGLFAGSGSAYDAFSLDRSGLLGLFPKRLRSKEDYGIENSLAQVSGQDFFVDFTARGKLPDAWLQRSFGRAETSEKMPLILARDFHAAIYIQNVHPADLRFFPAWLSLLFRAGGSLLQHPFFFGTLAIACAALLMRSVIRRYRRRPAC